MMQLIPHRRRVRSFAADASSCDRLSQRYAGAHPIPVDQIVGSVGRAHELRSNFRVAGKRQPQREERYERIREVLEQRPLPPIEVYRLKNRYYVVDGHHRVAAARANRQIDIDAVVREFIPQGTCDCAA